MNRIQKSIMLTLLVWVVDFVTIIMLHNNIIATIYNFKKVSPLEAFGLLLVMYFVTNNQTVFPDMHNGQKQKIQHIMLSLMILAMSIILAMYI